MHPLNIGVPIPKIVVCSTKADIREAKRLGLPYVVWRGTDKQLAGMILLPWLKMKFPHIDWSKHLGLIGKKQPIVHNAVEENIKGFSELGRSGDNSISNHIDGGYRVFEDDGDDAEDSDMVLGSYIGDIPHVDITVLEDLDILPKWFGNITSVIQENLADLYWQDGYNKKLGMMTGSYKGTDQARNLMIIDISGSIPRGISDTMIALADTLRGRCNADLIITGSRSMFWQANESLPDPCSIRELIGRGNEAQQFYRILRELDGAEYDNVICFGDNDAPDMFMEYGRCFTELGEPKINRGSSHIAWIAKNESKIKPTYIHVGNLMSFHTKSRRTPGYALVFKSMNPEIEETINTSWAKGLR